MKKTTATLVMAAGIGGLGINVHDYATRFDNESIWKRQSMMVERYVRDVPTKKAKLDDLRAGITSLDSSSSEERCRFEKRFEAVVVNKGDVKAAEADIAMKSFEPYAECKGGAQTGRLVYNYGTLASALALLAGAVSLMRNFFGKKPDGSGQASP